jgi:ligand-binding sensor domain-containing protein
LGAAAFRALGACAVLLAVLVTPAWCVWQTFGIADGLAALNIQALAQDRAENLWFATPAGATRYDGATFRTFTHVDGLIVDNVQALLADRSGRVWFGTASGVSVFDGTGWSDYTTSDGLTANDVRGMFQDRAGRYWFATAGGVSRFDGTTWTSYHVSDGLASDRVNCVFEDRAGVMWFGTETGGLSRFDGTTWTTYKNSTTGGELGSDVILCVTQTRDGMLWVGTKFGQLSRFDGTSWKLFTMAGAISLGDVKGLAEDRSGLLWAACGGGLARYDGRTWRSYTTADGLAGNVLSALLIDGNGNLWAGTPDKGASRYDGESWTTYLDGPLGAWGARAMLEDSAGSIWAATGAAGSPSGAGVVRFDRASWTTIDGISTGGGLASDAVKALAQDSTGRMWFGTTAGASRFDGATWRTFTIADGLPGNDVNALARDSSGGMWVGTSAGLSRYDDASWTTYTTANGLPANLVRSLYVARDGSLWCGTNAGVAHRQGTTWTTYTTTDGLAGPIVWSILQDRTGAMWFGTQTGLSRFDGASWRTYLIADGLPNNWAYSLAETPDSVLWVGTRDGGLARFDGSSWHTYVTIDGLPDNTVFATMVERSGNLWLGTASGTALYEPARVPPQTVITTPPPKLSANRLQTVPFVAAYRQTLGIEFSTALDNDPWSPWTPDAVWVGRDLVDGVHTLRVRARDLLYNLDPTPATATFEVAATPPIPTLSSPASRQPAQDTLLIRGTATALRFRSLKVEMRPAGYPTWDPPTTVTLAQSTTPVIDGVIARLGTKDFPDGDYELRLSVLDTLGLTGYAQVTFIVDNVAPFAVQTTPAVVSALGGGDVFTTNREAHVYIPPRGLPKDATISIDPPGNLPAPVTLPDGASLVAPGFVIGATSGTEGVPLLKPAILDVALPISTITIPAGTRLAFYAAGADQVWKRLGGTIDESGQRLATTITAAGSYAVYAAPGDATLPAALKVTLAPRVLSSRGVIASTSVKIAFDLARAGTARVTIHNRAGRLVRVVISGESLGPGTNLVTWDGRDEDHKDVDAGLYFVTVEALGETKTQTLGVVR